MERSFPAPTPGRCPSSPDPETLGSTSATCAEGSCCHPAGFSLRATACRSLITHICCSSCIAYKIRNSIRVFVSSLTPSKSNYEYQVVLGGVNIEKAEESDQTIPVIQTIVHENYRETRFAVYNDIGTLQHSSNTVSSLHIQSVSTSASPLSPAEARSHRQPLLCQGDPLCQVGVSPRADLPGWERVRHFRMGRHRRR